ncbi:MAG: o-succinylbenzoate synthase [Myxococcales bacterium]|nr:o-succinylbenzoate synthase [Myxococcales bacterium]
MMPARALSALEIRPYRLRLARPLRTARGVVEHRDGFVVLARDGNLVGRGEAAPLYGTESLAECFDELRKATLDSLPAAPAARHAVEQALFDLSAQRLGVPLARLLDARAAESVGVSALLSAETMPELAREAQRAAAEGYRTLKLKVGLANDYARAAVVRDAVGPNMKLRVDANGAWRRDEALERLHELAPLDIELCEQPTEDLAGLETAPITIAADELVPRDPDAALDRAQVIVLKPMLLGGLLPALRLGRRALERGRQIVVTTSLDGAIARAGAAHLAAALRQTDLAAGLSTGRLLAEDLCSDTLAPRGGSIRIPDAPGLGL